MQVIYIKFGFFVVILVEIFIRNGNERSCNCLTRSPFTTDLIYDSIFS